MLVWHSPFNIIGQIASLREGAASPQYEYAAAAGGRWARLPAAAALWVWTPLPCRRPVRVRFRGP